MLPTHYQSLKAMLTNRNFYGALLTFVLFECTVFYFLRGNTTGASLENHEGNSNRTGAPYSYYGMMATSKMNARYGQVVCDPETFKKTCELTFVNCSCVCISTNATLLEMKLNIVQLTEYIRQHRFEQLACAMSFQPNGRLGNLMGEYATLYALAKVNQRPAILEESMAKTLRSYFKVSLPMLAKDDYDELEYMWTNVELRRWMEPSYKRFNEMFIRFLGPPYSWTFYDHLREEILREFTFHEDIKDAVDSELSEIASTRKSVTFVGVHARRTDAIQWIKNYFGVVADGSFFRKAMDYFRAKYDDAVFVVASDDMTWCKKSIDTSRNDVYFVGHGKVENPIHDFALLSSCNHSIISVGTYGYWTAYLAGGEVVYFANYTRPDSHYLKKFTYETIYLPHWKGISGSSAIL